MELLDGSFGTFGAPPGYLKLLAPLPEGVVVSNVMNSTHKFVQFLATRVSAFQK